MTKYLICSLLLGAGLHIFGMLRKDTLNLNPRWTCEKEAKESHPSFKFYTNIESLGAILFLIGAVGLFFD